MASKVSVRMNDVMNYATKYKNPENYIQIEQKLCQCKSMGEVEELVKSVFPTWIIDYLDGYSDDYPQFTNNWYKICDMIPHKPEPAKILIVEDIIHNSENFSLIQKFAEVYTSAGFAVRRQLEIIPCVKCRAGLPSIMVFDYMKNKNLLDKSTVWSDTCSGCK